MLDFIKTSLGIRITLLIGLFLMAVVMTGAGIVYLFQTDEIDEQCIPKARTLSGIGAQGVRQVIESAIEKRVFSEKEAFDKQYEQIPGFVPPKYHTQYDSYLDREIVKFQDAFLKDPNILYAIAMDTNGYVPTHNTRYQKEHTGDYQKDYYGNRTKRILNDPVTVNAIRSDQESIIQRFAFDSKIDAWDISTPIFVNGKHWGCFSVGYKANGSENVRWSLFRRLFIGVFLFLGISIAAVYLIVQRSLLPLVELAQTAIHLADGDVERKIRSGREDEIGQIQEALDRLRVSLKAAMERLKRG
ncbi:MAG: HAMP domain-containing protein [Pseudomonadota bacterium]